LITLLKRFEAGGGGVLPFKEEEDGLLNGPVWFQSLLSGSDQC